MQWGTGKLNAALGVLVQCLGSLIDHAQEKDPAIHVPFEVEPGSVGGIPITFKKGHEERWARAMACLVMDLKWLMLLVLRPMR